MSDERKYVYPVEELDKIIEQMDKGIIPMMDDTLQTEVELRYKEIKDALFGGDDEDEELDAETVRKHRELMNKHINDQKRKASRNDVYVMNISDAQKEEIRKSMSVSLVRPNPNNVYNKRDEDLYDDNQLRVIKQRLAGLKNCYYNQTDYINAMTIIRDAIEYSLEHDYPWMSKEEAIQQFNAGKIKFKYCNIPKLYINHSTQINDVEILKGIMTGEITLKDRRDDKDALNMNKRNKKYTPVEFDYTVTSDDTYHQMILAHKQGYDTPMSTVIKHKSTVYNRLSIPVTNIFAKNNTINNQPIEFDWTKEGAGEAYFNMINGKKTQTSDVIGMINSNNDNMLNNVIVHNMNNFLRSMKQNSSQTGGYDYIPNMYNGMQYNQEAAKIENDLLASIRLNNPGQ